MYGVGVRVGFLGPADGFAGDVSSACEFLHSELKAERIVYLGADDALLGVQQNWEDALKAAATAIKGADKFGALVGDLDLQLSSRARNGSLLTFILQSIYILFTYYFRCLIH